MPRKPDSVVTPKPKRKVTFVAATAVEVSANSKLGPVSATYASQHSCPACPFRGGGCYAETGAVGFQTRRLNACPETDPVKIAQVEADAIDRLSATRPLRLHVVGDASTPEAAEIVSGAAARYQAKSVICGPETPVWTYTHAWTAVPRSSWKGVSVLASCETLADAKLAMSRGYAASLVVDRFDKEKAYTLGTSDVKAIPCPNQTRGVKCAECLLCADDDSLLARRQVIAFRAHGSSENRVRHALRVLNGLE